MAVPGLVEHGLGGRFGASTPSTSLASVVLPEPDSPTMATLSPGATARSTPASARTTPLPTG